MKPSSFTKHPYDSVFKNTEHEIVARNIMNILKRTGDKFRPLSYNEYQSERQKDGGFSVGERYYFDRVIQYCQSADTAKLFCPDWSERNKLRIDVVAGTHLRSICKDTVEIAKANDCDVSFDFNGVNITATPESSCRELEDYFHVECESRQKAYASSPEGIAAKEKRAAEIVQKQNDVDGYTKSLPVVLASNNLSAVVGWLRMFADVADDVGVRINHQKIYRLFKNSGFIANDYVGSNQYLNERFFSFNRKNRLGRYLIGQAMSCLKSKMPPHPALTDKFCAEYFAAVKS